jgi:hypothetical protein
MSPDELRRTFGKDRADLIAGGYLKPSDLVRMVDRGRWGQQPRLATVADARMIAGVRGWTPKGTTPGRLKAAPERPDLQGLDDLFAHGPGSSRQAEVDRLHAQFVDFSDRRQAIVKDMEAFERREAAKGRKSWDYAFDQEYLDKRARLRELDDDWKDLTRAQKTAWKADREALKSSLAVKVGPGGDLLPLDQARRLKRDMDEYDTWVQKQRGRIGSAGHGQGLWTDMVDSLGHERGPIRSLIVSRLPVRERFRPPQAGDLTAQGAKSTLGGGKRLAQVTDAWNMMVDLAEYQERLTGWKTNWSGVIEYGTRGTRNAAGVAHWDGSIGLAADYFGRTGYDLKVLLHEGFHMMSGGGTRSSQGYGHMPGWEEGVVERLAQVHQQRATIAAGKEYTGPVNVTYQGYTAPLEVMRTALGMSEDGFYLELLKYRITERPAVVAQWATEKGVDPALVTKVERAISAARLYQGAKVIGL